MDYLIIILLVIIIILIVISLMKNINESKITDRLNNLEINTIKELNEFKDNLTKNLTDDFTKLNESLERRLLAINEGVNERINQNFEKTNKTFTSVIERLSKIDEAQKKIDTLSTDIISLQSILTDKKTRGIYGEVNLKHILVNVFGEGNDSIYRLQYTLPNGTIADSVLFAPDPLGTIAIDSKFPLEHYQIMVNKDLSKSEREAATKAFKNDVKKHIDAISSKYIIDGVTSDQAIMFLPAEALFAEINAYLSELLNYAYSKKVWIAGPTTLISTLSIISMILKNMERDKYSKIIHDELNKLSVEFSRYKDRWDKLARNVKTVNQSIEDLHTTSEKISKRFDSINSVDIDKLINKEEKEIVTN